MDIRLTTGKSVRDAYMNDNREVRVGSGLQGLHHAKCVLVLRASSAAELIIASTNWTNWTTSSRANREAGVQLKFASHRARTIRDWVADFEASSRSGVTLQMRSRVETRPWLVELGTTCPVRPLQLPPGPRVRLVAPGSPATQEAWSLARRPDA